MRARERRRPSPSATSSRRRRPTCWSIPRSHYANAADLAAGEPETAVAPDRRGARGRGGRGSRGGLPAGVQHRAGRAPDRVPRPPARARRPVDGLAPGMSRGSARSSPPPRSRWSWPRVAARRTPRRRPRRPRPHPAREHDGAPRSTRSPDHAQAGEADPAAQGEVKQVLRLAKPYTPSPPNGVGTDDYHCFLLDPKLAHDTAITGYDIRPGNLARGAPRDPVPGAARRRSSRPRRRTPRRPGDGWTCFGNSGIDNDPGLDDAPWLGAWAPGGGERRYGTGLGTPLTKGSRIVVQIHYNLLAGHAARPELGSAARDQAGRPRDHAAHDAAAGAGRAAVPQRTTTRHRCATVPPPSPT